MLRMLKYLHIMYFIIRTLLKLDFISKSVASHKHRTSLLFDLFVSNNERERRVGNGFVLYLLSLTLSLKYTREDKSANDSFVLLWLWIEYQRFRCSQPLNQQHLLHYIFSLCLVIYQACN